jgi:hypothetical protein
MLRFQNTSPVSSAQRDCLLRLLGRNGRKSPRRPKSLNLLGCGVAGRPVFRIDADLDDDAVFGPRRLRTQNHASPQWTVSLLTASEPSQAVRSWHLQPKLLPLTCPAQSEPQGRSFLNC